MKYAPKTTEWMRKNNWGAEAQQLVTTDLTSCESCLAEAEREIAALRETCDILWDHPEWIPMLKARKAMTGEEKTYSTEEVRQLLNSEGRAGK